MKPMIYCKKKNQGTHSVYLRVEEGTFFLFHQNYRKSVQTYFAKGVTINQAMDFSKTHRDVALRRTMEKMPMYITYVEKEQNLVILRKTEKKRINLKVRNYENVCA